jgi:hypothetical protein
MVYQIYLCLKFTVGISDVFMFEIYSWYIRFIYVWNLQLVYQIYLCLKFIVGISDLFMFEIYSSKIMFFLKGANLPLS